MKITVKSRYDRRKVKDQEIFKYVHTQLMRLWRDSTREFLKAAAAVLTRGDHIDTGMSYASFQPLAARLRIATLLRESARGKSKGPKFPAYDVNGNRIARAKSKTLGRELGENAYTLDFGTPAAPEFNFQFKIVVFQYKLHEAGIGQRGDPWNTLGVGKQAFLEYFNSNFNEYVESSVVTNWLATGRIT